MQKDVRVYSSVIQYIFMLKFCTFSYLDTCKVCVPVRCLLCSIWSSDRWAAELRLHHILAEWCPKISLCQENKRHHFNQKEQIVLVILILCLLFIHYLLFPGMSNNAFTPTQRIMGTCINTNVISHFMMQWQVSTDVQNVVVRTQQAVKSFVEQTTIQREFKPSCVIRGSSHGSCGLWLAWSLVIVFKCTTMYNVEHTQRALPSTLDIFDSIWLQVLWQYCDIRASKLTTSQMIRQHRLLFASGVNMYQMSL